MGKYCFTYDCKSLCIGIGIWKSFVRFTSLYNCLISEVQKGPILLIGVSTFDFFLPASPLCTGSSLFLDLGVRGETANLPQKSLQLCLCHYLLSLSFWSHLYLDKEAAERLSKTVDEACLLLAEYNGRLAAELEDRRQLARMLVEYTQNQKDVLSEKEKKLEVSTRQGRPKLPKFTFLEPTLGGFHYALISTFFSLKHS